MILSNYPTIGVEFPRTKPFAQPHPGGEPGGGDKVYAGAERNFARVPFQDLLCDLQAENGAAREEFKAPSVSQPIEIACPHAQIKEPQQEFCGFCGADFPVLPRPGAKKPHQPSDLDAPAAANPAPSLRPVQSVSFCLERADSLRELSFSTIYGAEESNAMGRSMPLSCWSDLVCWALWALRSGGCSSRQRKRLVAPSATATSAQANNAPRCRHLPLQEKPGQRHPRPDFRKTTVRHLDPHPRALNSREAVQLMWMMRVQPQIHLPQALNPGLSRLDADQANCNKVNHRTASLPG